MGFQPRRLIGQQSISGGVRLVKTVTGKLFNKIKNPHCKFGIYSLLTGTLFKNTALLGHFFGLFLAHGAAQHISTTQRVSSQHLRDLHDLFLVDNYTVSRTQHRLQRLMLKFCIRVGHLGSTVLAIDEIIHHARLQWTGPEQCHQRDNILKTVRFHPLDQIFHSPGFKLKHRSRFCTPHQSIGCRVIQRNCVNSNGEFTDLCQTLIDHFDGPVNNGQCSQTEKVKFHQPRFLYIILVKLGYQPLTVFIAIQWREICQSGWRDHDTAGMLTNIAGDALKLKRHLPDFLSFFITFKKLSQDLLLSNRFFQSHTYIRWNHF